MKNETVPAKDRRMTGLFERYRTVWVGLCIITGILMGEIAPGIAKTLDSMAIHINGAPVVSIPIAVCLFFMMYPIMVKIDFASVVQAGKGGKPVFLTLFINWCIKPFRGSHCHRSYAIRSPFGCSPCNSRRCAH